MWKKLLRWLFPSQEIEVDPMKYLIVGLGNMGAEYDNTRHNIGFDVIDTLARQFDVEFEHESLGDLGKFKYKGRTIYLLKPSTYMNRSGKAVRYWCNKLKIQASNLLVLVDEIQLDQGQLRMRAKGSDGGHNGLKDIQEKLGTTQYNRMRIGIGSEFHKGQQVNYVLGHWSDEESEIMKGVVEDAAKAVLDYCCIGMARAMNVHNR